MLLVPYVLKGTAMISDRRRGTSPSYPIPVWNGIFDHRENIGPAVWVFLWCIDRITKEKLGSGFVLSGSVISAGAIAEQLKDSERTVRRHLHRLSENGYITLKLASYGFIITVTNSCKFGIWRSDKNVRLVEDSGRTKLVSPPALLSDPSTKIARPNKEDTAVDSAVTPQEPCSRCHGTGRKASLTTPGKIVLCECTDSNIDLIEHGFSSARSDSLASSKCVVGRGR